MIRIPITELKNQLSKYLRLVKEGEVVEVLERKVPIARLEGIPKSSPPQNDVRERLIRDGLVSPARGKPSRDLLDAPPLPCPVDAVRILVEERGDR